LYTTVFDPITTCTPRARPENVTVNGSLVSWSAVSGAIGYVVYKDGKYLASPTDITFTDNPGSTGIYSVRAVNPVGVLSEVASIPTSLSKIQLKDLEIYVNSQSIKLNQPVDLIQLLSTTGNIIAQNTSESELSLNTFYQGVFILKINTKGSVFTKKIALNMK